MRQHLLAVGDIEQLDLAAARRLAAADREHLAVGREVEGRHAIGERRRRRRASRSCRSSFHSVVQIPSGTASAMPCHRGTRSWSRLDFDGRAGRGVPGVNQAVVADRDQVAPSGEKATL